MHDSFQNFLSKRAQDEASFDSVVCNPPYFDRSLECPTLGRTRARHSSSLPFSVLAEGVASLLCDGGTFTVCIPPEVLSDFNAACFLAGFWLQYNYNIKSVPEKGTKRHILIYKKGIAEAPTQEQTFCMRNADKTISLTQCCEVSGLGPGVTPVVLKAAPNVKENKRRDGSFEYYMSEPIRDNDGKGVGPFIWASLEMEQQGLPIEE